MKNKHSIAEEDERMRNKKTSAMIIGIIIMFSLVGCRSGSYTKKPFDDLKSSNIAAATVRILPPDITIQIENTDELVRLLRKIAVTELSAPDNSTLSGQNVIFDLYLSDGSHKEIQIYYPYVVIDGINYMAKSRPCEALNRYANELTERIEAK